MDGVTLAGVIIGAALKQQRDHRDLHQDVRRARVRKRVKFEREESLRHTVDTIHGHVMRMCEVFTQRTPDYLERLQGDMSPFANEYHLGALAETREGRSVVDFYAEAKRAMRRGNRRDFEIAANHLDAAIDEWREGHPA